MLIKRFLQILIVMILFLMVPNYLYAYDFELGGIYYNLSGSSVIVTSGDIKYQGDVSIPDQVLYKGETYKVISIGSFAFSNCSGLTSVKIPNSINSIGFYAFSDNKDLISITIPSSVTIIGEGAFSSCRGLTSLTLPNSITIIKDNAFCYCIGLTSITIPNSVTSIGKSIFRGCTSLISISVEKGNTNYDSRDYCNAIIESFSNTLVVGCKNTIIPNSVTSIANEAFSVCSGLTSVTIPNSVSSIGRAAFEESGLISVKIPASVRYIGDSAFNMYSLLSVISEIRDPFPIDSRVFSSNTYNKGQLIVPEGESSAYKSTDGWNKFVNMVEDKPDINYTFSITASGNGSATYDGTTARNETKTFTLNEGANATVIFSPDNGYRVKSVKVNNTDVTSSVSNNSYAISNINSNTTVEVEFEAIPVTTYELSVRATGNGSATYDGVTIRDNSRSFTVDEGEYATITFVPDEGYWIKSLMVNSSDVTSQISNNSFTIDGISANTTVEVEFEAIPVTTYTLSVLARGNGSATYGGVTIRDNSRSFTVDEGEYATITFVPDEGYWIKSLMVNSSDVTSQISNNSFTIDGISANTTVEVEFEAIPVTTYTLSVLARGNGSATYGGVTIRDDSRYFTVNEGAYATITFIPDEGYRIKSLMVNSSDVTSQISNNSFTIDGISANTTVEVDFEAIPVTTYTLSVLARGNGSATYDGVTIRDDSRYFTVNEGEYATILFSPDEGYQIKNLMVNNFDVTSQILNNSYTISNINANTMIEVEFEAIATRKCTLTLKAMGNGSAWYNGVAVTNSIQTFSIEAGALVIISFLPSDDYNIKSVKVDNVTTQISGNQYIINSISADTTIEVEFESDSNISGYTLTIKALGNGTVWYEKSVRNSEETIIIQPDSSPIIAFLPDTGYRIKSVKNNGEDVTSQVISNRYTISNVSTNITLEVEFEAIPATTYTLTITASGNGYVSYGGITTSNNSKSFTLNEGTSATITFSPDNGYRIKSVKVNSVDVTSIVSNNQYSINNINENTTVDVEFEEIPAINPDDDPSISGKCGENVYYYFDSQTQTLTISGEGDMYNLDFPWHSYCEDIHNVIIETGVSAIGKNAFRGCTGLTSVTIPNSVTSIGTFAFSGCIGLTSVTIPNSVTTIGNFAFEACIGLTSIAIPNSVTSIGEDSFDDCRGLTSVHISDLAAWCNINFFSNYSNPLFYAHHLYLNGKEIVDLVIPAGVTSIGNYAFYRFSGLTFVTIPAGVTSIGDYAFYDCNSLKTIVSEIETPYVIKSQTFSEETFINAELIVPKGTKAAYQTMGGWMNFVNIVEAEDTEPDQPSQIHINDIYYKVTGPGEAEVVSFEDGEKCVSIPSTISYNNLSYKVTSIAKDACESHEHLAAVIWEPEAQFNAIVNNPNFLLYVNNEKFASHTVKNVVVNGIAESIELTDAANGNDFYCPRTFKARSIVYSHNYQMETGIGDSRGWETIVLPFDVQKYTHATKGELEPFTTWSKGGSKKPFWLFELSASGYKDVAGIKANTPYIISMPNNQQYEQQYQIPGVVTFFASDVEVLKSDNLKSGNYQGRSFVPNYTNKSDDNYLPLNVSNNYVTNPGKDISGSKFVRGLRAVHPFEAYMTTSDNTRSIDVMEGMTTAIRGIQMVKDGASVIKVYDTRGVLMKTATSMDDVRNGLKAGVYIVNGKKMVIK